MASVWKHPESRFWYAQYKDEAGRMRNKSTKVLARPNLKNQAWRIAEIWETTAQKGRAGYLILTQIQDGAQEIAERISPASFKKETIREFLTAWLVEKAVNTSASTITGYKAFVNRFLKVMEGRADVPLATLTVEDLRRHRDALEKDGMASESIHRNQVVPFPPAYVANALGSEWCFGGNPHENYRP